MTATVSAPMLWYKRGQKLWKDGKPCPPKPSDECTGLEDHSLLWIGWRVACAMDHMDRCEVARRLNMPEPEFSDAPTTPA